MISLNWQINGFYLYSKLNELRNNLIFTFRVIKHLLSVMICEMDRDKLDTWQALIVTS